MSNSIDDLFGKTFKKGEEDKPVQKDIDTSSSVVKRLLQRKEQQTQKTYCSWLNDWNNIVESNNNASGGEIEIPKHTICGDIGCYFTEPEKENIVTIVYEVLESYSQKTNKKYLYVEKLDSSVEMKGDKSFKTYYIEHPFQSGNHLVFLHFDKENNQVLVNNGILLPDDENGHVVKVTKDPLILHFNNTSIKRNDEKDFSFNNVSEEQKNDFLNGIKDTYCDIDIDSTIITIDPETYEPLPKEIVFEEGTYKARLHMKAGKNYFSFQIQSQGETDSELTDFQLAKCYFYGKGDFPEDKLKAAEIFEKVGDGESLHYLAHIWLDDSELTLDDLNEGIFYLEESDKFENPKAGCELIYYLMKSLYIDSMNCQDEIIQKMLQQIDKMTEKDFMSAMFLAGYIYEKGVVISRDVDKAFYYYYEAASKGEKTAKIRLGIHSTTSESDKESCKNIFCNSQNNSGFSDYCMGRFLYDTDELLVNTSDFLHFYEIAADAGNYHAIKELAEFYAVGDNLGGVEPNPAKAIMLYERLTDISDIDSDWGTRVANYYLDGKGCESCEANDKKAFELLSYLSTKYTGGVVANNLGWMYKNGRGCLIDYSKAKELFESSNSKGSYYHLGDMYENGLGVEVDMTKAISLYKTAVEKGHLKAKERLDELSQSQSEVSLKEIHEELINVRQGITDANTKLEHTNSELNMTKTEVQQAREDMKKHTTEIISQIGTLKSFVEQDLLKYLNSMQNTLGNYIKETVEKEFENLSLFFSEEKKIAKELKVKSDFINRRTGNEDVNELVKQEQVYLQTLFGEKWQSLDLTTKSSLCSAGVLWKACADIKDESFDFSGICISATSALELELKRCFYYGFQSFLEQKYGAPSFETWPEMLLKKDKGELYLERGNGDDFTIGSLPFLLGKYGLNNIKNESHRIEQENLLKHKNEEYLAEVMIRKNTNGTNRESLIYGKNNLVYKTESVRRDYRNPAAHCNLINKLNAQKCYVSIIGKIESFDYKSDITSLLIHLYDLIDINKVSNYLNNN